MRTHFRLRRCYSALALSLLAALSVASCENSPTTAKPPAALWVTLQAAGVNLGSARVFTSAGRPLETVFGRGTIRVALPAGEYMVQLTDEEGNPAYDVTSRLLFVPRAEGALLDPEARHLAGVTLPLMSLHVGRTNVPAGGAAYSVSGTSEASARARVVWEAARAMVGPNAANGYNWSSTSTYGSYSYVGEDPGAWAAAKAAYGTNLSCRADNNKSNNYSPCALTTGPVDPVAYSCQGQCAKATRYRGGQCKAAQNLVLYRSGMYHNPNWAFRTLPTDAAIKGTAYPSAKLTTIQAGDPLRMPSGHSTLVVAVKSNQVVVWDSNFVGGDGGEMIASHVMTFSGTGVSNLSNYKVLSCVYSAAAPC